MSFSSSEGVGMGAVEAAMRDKPVIITDYGGAPEYVKTPYTISIVDFKSCRMMTSYLRKGMQWGKPDKDTTLGVHGGCIQ